MNGVHGTTKKTTDHLNLKKATEVQDKNPPSQKKSVPRQPKKSQIEHAPRVNNKKNTQFQTTHLTCPESVTRVRDYKTVSVSSSSAPPRRDAWNRTWCCSQQCTSLDKAESGSFKSPVVDPWATESTWKRSTCYAALLHKVGRRHVCIPRQRHGASFLGASCRVVALAAEAPALRTACSMPPHEPVLHPCIAPFLS